MISKVPNWEIAVYAVHLLGGISNRIHTEDIALKCFELVPDSFSWVKYPQYPDKDVVRSGLVDARKKKNGCLVNGRSGRGKGHARRTNADPALDGWTLTEAGVKWISENESRLSTVLGYHQASSHRQEILHKLSRIQQHGLFKQFLEQPEGFSPSVGEMAELFRCRVDADRSIWEKRFQGAVNLAQAVNDALILQFIEKCRASLQSQSFTS
jgi:hypothetical protein